MKEKSLFEQKGIGYTEYNGVLIPNVVMPKSKNYQLGKFGKLHKKWLKENHKSIYTIKLMIGELDSYIADVDKRATEMYDNLVKQLAEKRRYYRTTQSKRYDNLGKSYEQYLKSFKRDCV